MEKSIADQAVEAYMAMVDMTTSFIWPLKMNDDELPTSHESVLRELRIQGPMNLTQLAHQVSVAKQTMTDISTKLIKLGYVERIHNENNRRQILLKLTPAGNDRVTSYERIRFEYMKNCVFSALSEEQLHLLHDTCHTICRLQNQTIIGEKFGSRGLAE